MSELCSLAILEFLIQANGCLRIEDLWRALVAKFHHCSQVLSVIGPSLESLEQFIIRQPALFKILHGCVYATDTQFTPNDSDTTGLIRLKGAAGSEDASYGQLSGQGMEPEMQAVKYFQEHLLKKPDRWVPIKRLAGHLSQASASIRMAVGPQSEFVNFLLRHPLFFHIQGDLVGLSENIRTNLTACLPGSYKKKPRPVSYQGIEETQRKSFVDRAQLPVCLPAANSTGCKEIVSGNDTIVLSIEECKALLWIQYTVETNSSSTITLGLLLSKLSNAPKCIHTSIGLTQIELTEFIKKYNKIFLFNETSQTIALCPTKAIDLVIVTRSTNVGEASVLLAQRGCVFCINRLWGIIDLGFHEHVFFDRSLFKHVTDLSKHFQVKETVFFNAVLASKESRAKWRATCVWKESDPLANYLQRLATKGQTRNSILDDALDYPDDPDSGLDTSEDRPNSKTSLKYLFEDISEAFEHCLHCFASIRLVDAWKIQTKPTPSQLSDAVHSLRLSTDDQADAVKQPSGFSESRSICSSPVSDLSTLSGVPSITGFADGYSSLRASFSVPHSEPDSNRSHCSCACKAGAEAIPPRLSSRTSVATQTMFTGDIMATKLYHEDVGIVV